MTVAASRFLLRPMTVLDVPRISAIEHESFPSTWPQTAYRRELQRNKLAAYMVVCEQPAEVLAERTASGQDELEIEAGTPTDSAETGVVSRFRRMIGRRRPNVATPMAEDPSEAIAGFVGLWFMVDEAHIVTIAVAPPYRRRGLGEALLIGAIELAERRDQEVVTLECRVSNAPAIALYEKYGFRKVGVRKRYYTDNNEDAAIMTTFPIRSEEFETEFARLRAAHAARWGAPHIAHPELG